MLISSAPAGTAATTMPRGFDARLGRLAAALAVVAPELWQLPHWLSFEVIEIGQQALARYGENPAAAVAAADPTLSALIALARERRDGQPA
jgi:hypothetical protein